MIFSNFLNLIFLTYIGKLLMSFRWENKKKSIVFFSLIFILICSINMYGITKIKALCVLFLSVVYVFLQFDAEWTRKILTVVIFYLINLFSEFVVVLLMHRFVGLNNLTNINSIEYIVSLILTNVVSLIIIFAFSKFKNKIDKLSLPVYTWTIVILPIVTLIFMLTIPDIYNTIEQSKIIIFVIFGMLFSNVILIVVFLRAVQSMNLKKELELIKYKEKYSSTKYELLDNQYKNSFDFLHNILNEFQKLSVLMNDKEYEKANVTIEELTKNTFNSFNNIFSNSLILNTIISTKTDILNKNNIKVSTVIEYNDLTFIDFCDQIDLLGNLLDYAINNTIESKEHETIIIKTKLRGEQILIQYKFVYKDVCDKEAIINMIKPTLTKYHAEITVKELNEDIVSVIIIFKDKTIDYSKECL